MLKRTGLSKLTASYFETTSDTTLYLRGTTSSGGYRHYTVLTEMMRATGKHRRKLTFENRPLLIDFIVDMIKPFTSRLIGAERHILTHWLRNSNFTIGEVETIYLRVGLMEICTICGRPGYLKTLKPRMAIGHINAGTSHYQKKALSPG